MTDLDSKTVRDRVAKAWEMIRAFDMNEPVQLAGGAAGKVPRFILVDADGKWLDSPAKAVALFDFVGGKTFLPQTDSDWVSQLLERFRLSVEWDVGLSAWRASTPVRKYGHPTTATGPTPGVAIVEVLVAAARLGSPPIKHPFKAVA